MSKPTPALDARLKQLMAALHENPKLMDELDVLRTAAAIGAELEREECARTVKRVSSAAWIVDAIRARGNK